MFLDKFAQFYLIKFINLKNVGVPPFVVILCLTQVLPEFKAQLLILPGSEIQDPFKGNPKWQEFLLLQAEAVDRLETLMENVWTLIDSIPNTSTKTNLSHSFIKFHVPEFINFFHNENERLLYGNACPLFSVAIGRSSLLQLTNMSESQNEIQHAQQEWLAVEEAVDRIHSIFNLSSNEIVKNEPGYEYRLIHMLTADPIPLSRPMFLGEYESEDEGFTFSKISELIDKLMTKHNEGKDPFLRSLLLLLSNMKQSDVNVHEPLNYFCYGNNEFGLIPDVFDVISDAATLLIMTDMKTLIMNIYLHTINIFVKGQHMNPKDEREKMWSEMLGRIETKVKFPFLDGNGWTHPPGPVIFKCDIPPKNILGHHGQWGRNISTGMHPSASPSFPYDVPAGPAKDNRTVAGYLDERSPEINAVGFQNTFKGYVESELVLDPMASCRGTCRQFRRPTPLCLNSPQHSPLFRNSHCTLSNSGCMDTSKCPHFAMNCGRIGGDIRICPSSHPSKLYDWIAYDKKVIGTYTGGTQIKDSTELTCQQNVTEAQEHWEMENGVVLHIPRLCELCLCTCMTPFDKKDQEYFDLSPLTSHVDKGYIVSAVRFVKVENTIRLAIEEGKAVIGGVIDERSLTWLQKSTDPNPTRVALGINTFYRVNIDIILGPAGSVVTGIRFQHNITERSLTLEIQSTPITWPENDPTTISLVTSAAKWVSVPNRHRDPIILYDPDDPKSQMGPSMPVSVLNSYINLRASSYERDLGQTVVPLFDAQPVHYHERRRWLKGIGIMHKGKGQSGGFICPTIVPAGPYKSLHFRPLPSSETVLAV